MSSLSSFPLLPPHIARNGMILASTAFIGLGLNAILDPRGYAANYGTPGSADLPATSAAANKVSSEVSSSSTEATSSATTSHWLTVVGQRMFSSGIVGMALSQSGNYRLMGIWLAAQGILGATSDILIVRARGMPWKATTSHVVGGAIFVIVSASLLAA